ncbi:MAG: hypothetical protein IM536_09830 [Pseudanabaena sp. M34BS1SP1A06MG]|nr:hypothetical protein [Pseudanabaena sp. M34BS1SP1A06MG]MCA6623667.1 hypothetical protein [Pseudanabaena sp. M165S2SP1A06QC]
MLVFKWLLPAIILLISYFSPSPVTTSYISGSVEWLTAAMEIAFDPKPELTGLIAL